MSRIKSRLHIFAYCILHAFLQGPSMNPFRFAPQLQSSPTLALEMAFKMIAQRADQWLLKTAGCTRRELWVLICVDGTQLSQRQIGSILDIHPNTMVKILDVMERKGLVKRTRPLDNRRVYIIEATNKGKKCVSVCNQNLAAAIKEIFEPLSEEQIKQINAYCVAIIDGHPEMHVNMGDTDG